jgi:UDP-N-acetylmuramate dehydrogenase
VFEPQTVEELQHLMQAVDDVPKCLGFGSNLLVNDTGIDFTVVRLGRSFRTAQPLPSSTILRVGGSYPLMQLARFAAGVGLSGLEFAAGIPGSLGGAVRMNAGAHHSDIGSIVERIRVVLPDGKIEELQAQELCFSYRSCSLPQAAIIIEADLRLVRGSSTDILSRTTQFLDYRKATQPLSLPSCGSVFRNPLPEESGLSAGALLERCGLKGTLFGGAEVSQLHANWIVNPKRKASALDVFSLIKVCRQQVQLRAAVALQPEVQLWGFESAGWE